MKTPGAKDRPRGVNIKCIRSVKQLGKAAMRQKPRLTGDVKRGILNTRETAARCQPDAVISGFG